jgi:hypothetical protein
MSSILDELVCFDTNQFIFGIRRSPQNPACREVLRRHLHKLAVYLPLEILIELHRNLYREEINAAYRILRHAREFVEDFVPVEISLLEHYERIGAKDGDARICAHLHQAKVGWLISENRDFLQELPELPFKVLSSQEALTVLES